MSQNSFYGGKQGRTYNIVAHYDNVKQMVDNFHKGGNYNDVNYNEYVIIDTIIKKNQKYNRENGLLYRRGMVYSTDFNPNKVILNDQNSVADYDMRKDEVYVYCSEEDLGKLLEDSQVLVKPSETAKTAQTNLPRYRHFKCVIIPDDEGGYKVSELHQGKLYTAEEAREANDNANIARPSDPKDAFYNYKEQWENFVLNPGGGAEYVGQIVGPKGDATQIEVVSWAGFEEALTNKSYDQVGKTLSTRRAGINEYIDKEGRESIDYYDDIQFGYCNIRDSKGNIGQALVAFDMPYTEIRINAVSISPYKPNIIKVTTLPPKRPADIRNIYYLESNEKYYIWDDTRVIKDPESEGYPDKYLKEPGFVEMTPWSVEQIEGDANPYHWRYSGLLREHQDSISHPYYKDFEVYIPKGIHGTDFNGFEPLNVGQEYELFYKWIDYNDLDLGETGTHGRKSLGKLKVVKETSLINDNTRSALQVDYFNGDQDIVDIPVVRAITFTKNTGLLELHIREGTKTQKPPIGTLEYITKIDKVNDKELSKDKKFVSYSNIENSQTKLPTEYDSSALINELVDTQLYGDNLLVLYSDKTYRQAIPELGRVALPYTGKDWIPGEGDVKNANPPLFYWKNLGPILNGEHVYGKFSSLEKLKEDCPNGFPDAKAGWVASVVREDPEHPGVFVTELYAYDYYGWTLNPSRYDPSNPGEAWYQIASVATNEVEPRTVIIVSEKNEDSVTPKTDGGLLQSYGYWFEISDIETATDNE